MYGSTNSQYSAADCVISSTIPFTQTLQADIDGLTDVSGIKVMQEKLKNSLVGVGTPNTDRFNLDTLCSSRIYALATFLDARYKDSFFPDRQKFRAQLHEWLLIELKKTASCDVSIESDCEAEVPEKCPRTDFASRVSSVAHDSPRAASKPKRDDQHDFNRAQNIEVPEYLLERRLATAAKFSEVLDYWKQNKAKFPVLAKLAKKFLSPPATSVPSEQLFSVAGSLYNERGSNLKAETAEKMLLLHQLLPQIDYSYTL